LTRAGDDGAPCGELEGRGERQRLGRRVEGGGETRRESVGHEGVAKDAVIGAVGQNVGEVELRASRDGGRVDRPEGREREKGDARILPRELGGSVTVIVGGDLDERGVDELRAERVGKVTLGARERPAPVHAREGRANARARVLTRGVGDDYGVRDQCAAGAPPTISAARCSTSRAFAYEMSASASSIGTHLHAVIPSSRCGLVAAFSDSIRKK